MCKVFCMCAKRWCFLTDLRRIALHHVQAAERLLPRYGSTQDVAAHLASARKALEALGRSEDDTARVELPKEGR